MRSSFNPYFNLIKTENKNAAAEPVLDEEPVFQLGETVMHPTEGVCSIEELKQMSFSKQQRLYYILKPIAEKSSSTVYLPVNRGNHTLRRLLTQETILKLIREAANDEPLWISDNKQRKECFTRILTEGDHVKMIRLIQELHEHRALREQEGKKNCAADEHILAEAEKRLHQEFSHVLHMTLEETVAFIRQNLQASLK